jgi:hypothetical protein
MCAHNTSLPLTACVENFSTQALIVSASVSITVYYELGYLLSKNNYSNSGEILFRGLLHIRRIAVQINPHCT